MISAISIWFVMTNKDDGKNTKTNGKVILSKWVLKFSNTNSTSKVKAIPPTIIEKREGQWGSIQ